MNSFLSILILIMSGTAAAAADLSRPLIDEPLYSGTSRIEVSDLTVVPDLADPAKRTMLRIERVETAADGSVPPNAATKTLQQVTVSRPRMRLALDIDLVAGQVLRAVLTDGTSAMLSPLVTVSAAPSPLSEPRPAEGPILIDEAACIGVSGLLPQGTARAHVVGETDPLGTATADAGGYAKIDFRRPVQESEQIVLESAVGSGPGTKSLRPLTVLPRSYLMLDQQYQENHRTLQITPPMACPSPPANLPSPMLGTSGHELGATYEFTSSGQRLFGPNCAAAVTVRSRLNQHLSRDWGVVNGTQAYPGNGLPPSVAGAPIIGPEKPATPEIQPVAAGADIIQVKNLNPSTIVHVEQLRDGKFISLPPVSDDDGLLGLAETAEEKDVITVWQEFCGENSDPHTVTVGAAPDTLAAVGPVGPVYECAASVQIAGVADGAWVKGLVEIAGGQGDLSAYAPPILLPDGGASTAHITPSQTLWAGWQIAAHQRVGGTESASGQLETVLSRPEGVTQPILKDPTLPGLTIGTRPLIGACSPVVEVTAQKGALLSFSAGGLLNRSAPAYLPTSRVGLDPGTIRPGMEVRAQASFCTDASPASDPLHAVGKLRVTGAAATDGVVIDLDDTHTLFRLDIERECPAPEALELQITSTKDTVVDIQDANPVTFPKDATRVSVLFIAKSTGVAEIEIANALAVDHVQVGSSDWNYDAATFRTPVKVSKWVLREEEIAMNNYPNQTNPTGVEGEFSAGTAWPIYIRRVAVNKPWLTMKFVDWLAPTPTTDVCNPSVWGIAAGVPGTHSDLSVGNYTMVDDGDGFFSTEISPEKELDRETLKACVSNPGHAGSPPYSVKVTYRELSAP